VAFSVVLLFSVSTGGDVKDRKNNVVQPSSCPMEGLLHCKHVGIHSTDPLSPYYKSSLILPDSSLNEQVG
jgi:hypothetical protein